MLVRILPYLLLVFMLACQVKEEVTDASQAIERDFTSSDFSVTLPTSGWKKQGDTLDVVLIHPYDVTVTGYPYLNAIIGSSVQRFYYQAGSGTKSLVFRYTVSALDEDTDGILFLNQVNLNGGSLQFVDTKGRVHQANTKLTLPSRSIKIDGQRPMIDSVLPPSAGVYKTGQYLTYTVTFTEPVYVNGPLRFEAIFNSGIVPIEYYAGAGTKELKFRRRIHNTDIDADGFTTNSILVGANQLTDRAGNTIPSVSFPVTTSNDVAINVEAPHVVSVTPPADSTYTLNQDITFVVEMSDAVTVTGQPALTLGLTTGNVLAQYVAATSTATQLRFTYKVQNNHADLDGVRVFPTIVLNGGSIKATSDGQPAVLGLTPPVTTGLLVDAVEGPLVYAVFAPSAGLYTEGQSLDFRLEFNRAISVTDTPQLEFMVGGVTLLADYEPGLSGPSNMVFRYTVQTGDVDMDGITLLSPLSLSGGIIEDADGKPANLHFAIPETQAVRIDAKAPSIVQVQVPSNGSYSINSQLDFKLRFDEIVEVDLSTSAPRLTLTMDSGTVYATYLGGSGTDSLLFRYTIAPGDVTTSLALDPVIDLDGSTIKDNVGLDADLNFTVPPMNIVADASGPTIQALTPPIDGTYGIEDELLFRVDWSEPVFINGQPKIHVVLDTGGTIFANYREDLSSSTSSFFSYSILEGNQDPDGVSWSTTVDLNGGSIQDQMGNLANLTLPLTAPSPNVIVDGIRPSVTGLTPPAAAWYRAGNVIEFTLNWNEDVVVSGVPQVKFLLGSTLAAADYDAGASTATTSVFRRTIAPGELDLDDIEALSAIYLNGGTIQDTAGNNAPLSLTIPTLTGVKVDAVAPEPLTTVAPAPGTYYQNENVDLKIFWSEPVTLSGSAYITLNVGGSTYQANYVAAESSGEITVFRYTVALNHQDTDGIEMGSAIILNPGATIQDAAGNDATSTTIQVTNLSEVKVDGVSPLVVDALTQGPAPGTYRENDALDFTLTFTESVNIVGTPAVTVLIGSTMQTVPYVSHLGATVTFRYVIPEGEEDFDGITLLSPLDFTNGQIQDASGNLARTSFQPKHFGFIVVDSRKPTVIASTSLNGSNQATDYFKGGSWIHYRLTFHENITVTGTPYLTLNIGGNTRYAYYNAAHSGSNYMTFRYQIGETTDLDLDGVSVSSTITLGGGSIRDAALNDADINFTFTETDYVHYKNTLARYHFENAVSTYGCGASSCISAIYDVSGNNKHISGVTGVVFWESGFAGNSTHMARFNSGSALHLPTLTGIRHFIVVMKSPTPSSTSTTKTHEILRGKSSLLAAETSRFNLKSSWISASQHFGSSSRFQRDAGSWSSYGTNFSSPSWSGNTHYIYSVSSSSSFNLYQGRLGGDNFNGDIAEVIFLDGSSTLSDAQLERIRDQLQAIHAVY